MVKMKGKVKRISKSDLKYKKIKLLTKCMLNPNINSRILEEDKNEFNSVLKYRMFNHILFFPKLVKYVNTYLNHLFMFNKYSPNQWIKTFAMILRRYGIEKTNELYYPRFKPSPRDAFFKSMRDYLNASGFNRELNLKELECVYQLYNSGVIDTSQLENFKKVGSGQEKITKKSNKLLVQPTEPEIKNNQVDNQGEIIQFVDNTRRAISLRTPCKKCSLKGKPNLIVKTNLEKLPGEVDVAIISFSPTRSEVMANGLFDDKNGEIFHNMLLDQVKNLKYVYTNVLLCEAPFDSTVTKHKEDIKICKSMVEEILGNFKPKIRVLLGNKVKSAVGITLPITKCHRQILNGNHIVIHSPEEVARDSKKTKRFMDGMTFIGETIKNNKTKETINTIQLPEDQMMNRVEKDWILFDTQIIDDEFILYTFTHHKTGQKGYIKRDVEFPIYIKYGNFRECDYVTDQVDDVIYLNAGEKKELQRQLNWNIQRVIKNV